MAKHESDKKKEADQQEELDRALRDQKREDLLGQTEENRNLTGSTTWETLGDEYNDENQQHGRRTQAASPREEQNPPRTTTGPITSPKFGSAGSGGAELEPGPEKD
ncbi:MAG TPA: hypothetical protein VFS44_02925 [Gemmatimonadaceae bacterium]|nr:hypothetical protein [Gemmatimonadaceae bacterium]